MMKLVLASLCLFSTLFLFENVSARDTQYGDRCDNTYQCNWGNRLQMWDCVDGLCVCSRWYSREVDFHGRYYCIVKPVDSQVNFYPEINSAGHSVATATTLTIAAAAAFFF